MGRRALIHHHEKDLCAPWAGQSNFAAHHVICVLEESNERFFFYMHNKTRIMCVCFFGDKKESTHAFEYLFFMFGWLAHG
jgi:hypothetical protein